MVDIGLFELFRDAVVVGDVDTGKIVLWNVAAEYLFGYSAAEAIGENVESLLPAAVVHVLREGLAHFTRTGETVVLNGRVPLEMSALTRRGDEVRVELTLAPLRPASAATAESRARHILLMFREACPAQRADMQALDAAGAKSTPAETEAKLRMSHQLLHDSTRELDTVLARAGKAAARLARLAQQDATSRPQRLALMARVVELRTERVQRTLQQIGDAAEIQLGTFHLDCARVNLVPVINRIVAAARKRSASHQMRLAAPQGLTAIVDGRRIEQVVKDLLHQAIQRNPRGCWIDVDLSRPLAGLARIEVRDYGRHLSARERDQLPDRALPGRSWFLIKHIVEQHRGNISVGFPAEGGLRVTLTLPTHRTSRSSAEKRV
jgi:PAS domain S-box-containing protein